MENKLVSLVARTLDLFQLFSDEARPLSLTEIARGLDAPASSTLALLRTLIVKGYLYETRRRSGYFPTRKMLALCHSIDKVDPIFEMTHGFLEELRDATEETTTLAKLRDTEVIYLDVVQSRRSIVYTVAIGDTRAIHANSLGKAIFSALAPEEQKSLLGKMQWNRLTPDTIVDKKKFMKEMAESAERGWAANVNESVAGLAAIAMPFRLVSEWYAIAVVGPMDRMNPRWSEHVEHLAATLSRLKAAVLLHEGRSPG
ncbi:IclR family transcriptional regulator [Bordetella genomosp. 10]|uniref:IclR family transcriptional regulator n=1 Tax=Bordetella genomosp. 10 TaxID=1416804 RepID=A0A261SM99_9BORD|nr:IclR family transcriptional regulator [Bordetella genomosp. 10]OZI38072.1 IclR family transcriptional regulator [Bordetella genomosp. 10]